MPHTSGSYSLPLIALLCSVLNIVICLLILLGWATDTRALANLFNTGFPVVPLTAVSVMIASFGLFFLARSQTTGRVQYLQASRRWALAGGAIAVIVLSEYLFAFQGGLESLLFAGHVSEWVGSGVPYPGRLAPQTAISLLVSCAGILLMGRQAPHARRDAGLLVAAGMIIPGIALVGHLVHIPAFHTLAGLSHMSMAAPTAGLLMLLGAGTLALSDPHPYRGPH